MPGWIGPWELAILLVVVLLIFGPKRLPEMGRSLGRGMREFKDSIVGKHDDERPELTAATEQPAAAAPVRERDTVG
jgi:sec-independent protein translocase protein TatA